MQHINFCARCETTFSKWELYAYHMQSKECVKVIKSVNTSGRTKAQIVNDAERTWLAPHIVGGVANFKPTEPMPDLFELAIGDIQWKS